MKIAKVFLLTWLVQLLKGSWSLNCPSLPRFDPGKCVCDSRFSSDRTGGIEMACFGDNVYEHAFIVDYAIDKHISVECSSVTSPYAPAMFSAFNASEINTFEFRSCLLPNTSFIDVLSNQKVYSLTFVSKKNITDLTYKHFENLKDLKVLVLKRNGLSTLPHKLFSNLTELQDLRLNDNSLQTVKGDSFAALYNLSSLEMGGNFIQELPENVFSQLHNLKYLYLYNNRLRRVPTKLFHSLRCLVTLDMSNNLLQEIPVALFQGLNALERISLRRNRLNNIPSSLFISNTLLLNIDLGINSQVRSLPETLFSGLTKLQTLNLERCNISNIPHKLFSPLTNLQILKLSNNRIKKLHQEVFQENTNLVILLFDSNHLETLANNLFDRQYLLTALSLFENNLRELPSGIFKNLVNLVSLNMAHNNISNLNWDTFISLQYLEILNLSNNKLKQISNFGLSSNLKKVDLSNNLLTSMPDIKETIHMKIQEVNLEYNNISYLNVPVVLSDMASIRLGWNRISLIDVDDLVMVYNANQLSEPDPKSEKRILRNSPRFYLFPNPIRCDCQIYHFVSYITAKEEIYSDQVPLAVFPFSQSLSCSEPSHLKGRRLSDLSLSDFFCPAVERCPSPCFCYRTTDNNKLVMNCSYRGLQTLPSTAPWNTNVLYFSGNLLRTLDGLNEITWENLTEIYLDNNYLKDFGTWNFRQNLTYISLERNVLSNLPLKFMSYLSEDPRLKVSLAHNHWVCSCPIIDMKGWLLENFQKVSDIDSIYCVTDAGRGNEVNILKASNDKLCPQDTWSHKSKLIIVCCLVVVIPLVLFVTIVLYYRNRWNLKRISSAQSYKFCGETWLWRMFGCPTTHKSMPEEKNEVGLNSNKNNSNLLMFVEYKIASLNPIPSNRNQDKLAGNDNPITNDSSNIPRNNNNNNKDCEETKASSKCVILELEVA